MREKTFPQVSGSGPAKVVIMNLVKTLVVAALFFMAACNNRDKAVPANEAGDIAHQLWNEKLPQVNLNHLESKVEDRGTAWHVTYSAPEGSMGGPLTLDIDKKSGEVLHGTMAQ
jgi:hypothetical protein